MMIDVPAQPGEGPAQLPTPEVNENQPAQPGEGPVELPTPQVTPQQPIVIRPVQRCGVDLNKHLCVTCGGVFHLAPDKIFLAVHKHCFHMKRLPSKFGIFVIIKLIGRTKNVPADSFVIFDTNS